MKVIVVTTFFPNACTPQRGLFVKNLLTAMKGESDIEVIAPTPYKPKLISTGVWDCLSRLKSKTVLDGLPVDHTRVFMIPKFEFITGLSYFLSIVKVIYEKIKEEKTILHAHRAFPDAVGVALAARIFKIPFVITAHGSDINIAAKRKLLRWQVNWALRSADVVIAVSNPILKQIDAMIPARKNTLIKIPCAGFDPVYFYPADQLKSRLERGLEAGGKYVLFVGNLLPIKGIEILLSAWSYLQSGEKFDKNVKLIIVGDGPKELALQDLASEICQKGTVLFAGTQDHKLIPCWINSADVTCLPSFNEGTPNIVIESLACGVPVVASNVGGIPDIFENRMSGILVEPGDVEALALALLTALTFQWDKEQLVKSVDGYQWKRLASRNLQVIEKIVR